jgi:CheY-like chemotaxis protein
MSRTVLIVDDEPDIREVAKLSLEAIGGWRVLTASGGREGVEQAVAERPDAMLLDAMMPDLDGPATLGLLRERLSAEELPVVMLTAKARGLGADRLEEIGAQGLIAKPFDPMRLHEQLAALLGWGPG